MINTVRKATLLILSLCIAGIISTNAVAENTTPSHVYQITEKLLTTLKYLGQIDEKTYNNYVPDNSLRHPRHVLQKARECDMLITKILEKNGVAPQAFPERSSPTEIRPADVKESVIHIVEQLRRISDTARNAADEEPPLIPGKLPGDVYNNLKHICGALTVKIIPSDVYRIAVTVRDNIVTIYKRRGGEEEDIPPLLNMPGKEPKDVYRETWSFMDNLRVLALHPDFAIPGGVILPDKEEGQIKPQNVIGLMNDALAETETIEYVLGIETRAQVPPFIPEKIPSDVFAVIYQANRIVEKLIDSENTRIKAIKDGQE